VLRYVLTIIGMRLLAIAARWELIILITAFGAVTVWKIFYSATFAGLLRSADGTLSPGRIQMLVLTVLTAMQYLLTTIHDPSHLPAIPSNLVMALGGSHAVYLGSKAWTSFVKRPNSEET
jgi:hypothetical protein